MLKKNFVVPVLLGSLLAAMLVTGCVSTKVWDETLPESETTKVWSYNGKIVVYNGIALEKGYYILQIPSGNATITIDMSYQYGNFIYKANGMEFAYFFEAGKGYFARTRYIYNEEDKSGVWGVDIYDELPGSVSFPGDEHFLEFVPFKIQPKFK